MTMPNICGCRFKQFIMICRIESTTYLRGNLEGKTTALNSSLTYILKVGDKIVAAKETEK